MNCFSNSIDNLSGFKQMLSAIENNEAPCTVTGISSIHKAQLIFTVYEKTGKNILVITDDEASAVKLTDDINEMAGRLLSKTYPAKDFTFTAAEGVSREYEYKRLDVLSSVLEKQCGIVVSGIEAAMQKTIPPKKLSERTFNISQGDEISTENLSRILTASGYSRCEQVEGASQYSIRGLIADIYPIQSNQPVRIEFWGDEVDSISYFDIETQRRLEAVDSIKISPSLEVMFDSTEAAEEKIQLAINSMRGKKAETVKLNFERDIEKLKNGIMFANIDKYLPLAYEKPAVIFDYFDVSDSILVMSEYVNIIEKSKGIISQYNEDIKILLEDGELSKQTADHYVEMPQLLSMSQKYQLFTFNTFMHSHQDLPIKKIIDITAYQTAAWGGEIRQLNEDLENLVNKKYAVIVMAGSEKTLPIIAEDIRESGIPCEIINDNTILEDSRVYLTTGCVSGGYDYPEIRRALITQAKAMSAKRKLKKRKHGEEIKSLSDISHGDLVVHSLHGIGRFEGIRKLELEGVTKDYITIKYAGTDVLYVPVTQLDLVSRYIGPRDDSNVRLNKLSSNEWQKTRSKVKSAVKDMADELIALYAKRSKTKGFAFSPDNDWQQEFEERFDYTETDDQLRSIEEIKLDMQNPQPMERLLCGDVGFGKTEVALRGAFKCMLDSKQCAILVPTTVLAWQHFQTALKRFEHFPIKIELLSRFRTSKQQEEIIKQLNRGEIDLIIGTHRLVQKDVKFKDLGLVIIDEEQRFGVAHKERFKEVFTGVDVLTLSATPIPRTLNMAMSGIRDMSVIEEPPQDRYPVQTYVVEHSMGIIAQAITRELRRGGQVYYIHNRIETIDYCAQKLQEQLPEARIGIAHGKITEDKLSNVWKQLLDHDIDILVCTTLIETGVDVPNCNTLIIEDADRLGLSQLYQLRGRVGRSNRRAFAYFTFKRGKIISEIASKRLDAIREFTQFGSGFRIAMRDLEIRGAGSLLGGKQHGHMEAVGYDMYLKILSETIAEERGDPLPPRSEECLVDIQIDAHIPDEYITSLSQRIDIYRKIASVTCEEEGSDLIDELIDRYGDPPKSMLGLIDVALLRNTASKLGISEIAQRGQNLLFFAKGITMDQILSLRNMYRGKVSFENAAKKPYFCIKTNKTERNLTLMQEVLDILSNSNLTAN